jgi:septal ring factor EnvC (AmiA/AmiB activator)
MTTKPTPHYLTALEAELAHLKSDYEDSDRQDTELRAAIRQQKKTIAAVKAWLK